MAQIIKTNGEVIEAQPKNGTDFSLEELQGIVGGYVEVVSIHYGQIIVLDEEGKLKGKDRNNKATELYRLRRLTTDFIVGDVLVCNDSEVR
jgi:hypothetical protein